MNNKMRKILPVLIITALLSQVINTGLVLAQQPTGQLSTLGGTAEVVQNPVNGTLVHLEAAGKATDTANESRIEIRFTETTTLNDLDNLSWTVNTTQGYPPHADILLSEDGENVSDQLVCEYAYQPHTGQVYEYQEPGDPYGHYDPGLQTSYYNPPYNQWVETFQNHTTETGTSMINNSTICWLGSGLPGPYNITGPAAFFGKLGEFKDGTVSAIGRPENSGISGDTQVLGIDIEVDNWIGHSEAYIGQITLNGESSPPSITIQSPSSTYSGDVPLEIEAKDLFTGLNITYDVMNSTGYLFYEDETYNGSTYLTGLEPGEYTLMVYAESMIGLVSEASEEFTVTVEDVMVDVTPETLNLKSRGRWVTVEIQFPEGTSTNGFDLDDISISIQGEDVEPRWYILGDGHIVLKLSRSRVQELAAGLDELEVTVAGTIDGISFDETDTIRVINPGKMNQNRENHRVQSQNGKGPRHNSKGKGPKPGKGNNGKAKGRK